MLDLTGRTALVAGASGGYGAVIAEALAERGANLGLSYLSNRSGGEAARAAAERHRVTVRLDQVDLADFDAVSGWVERSVAAFGAVDIAVSCVGWRPPTGFTPFVDLAPKYWRPILEADVVSQLNLTYAVLPHMMERRFGRLIAISSDAGKVGQSGAAVASAARGANNAFAKAIAREVGRFAITANTICPGPTEGRAEASAEIEGADSAGAKILDRLVRSVPMKRVAKRSEIAAAVVFLASDEAGYITGQNLSVSGGLTMI